MHQVKITSHGTFSLDQTIELTDEEWADAVDPSTGLVTDVGVIAEAAFHVGEGGSVCAQCSGYGRKFSLDMDDQTEVVRIIDEVSGNTIYDVNDVADAPENET